MNLRFPCFGRFSRRLMLFCLLGACVSPAVLLAGCSGSSTGSAAAPVGGTTLNFTLSNGQRISFNYSIVSTILSGSLQIRNATNSALRSSSQNLITQRLVAGDYGYTGTFSPPRGFSLVILVGGRNFTLNGILPTTVEAGSYTAIYNGETETGVLPVASNGLPTIPPPFPTAVATRTPAPTSTTGSGATP